MRRVCQCGCGVSLEGRDIRTLFSDGNCKARTYRGRRVDVVGFADRGRVRTANNRALERGLAGDLTYDEWLGIVADYNDRCAYCLGDWSEIEHVVSIAHPDCPGTARENVVPSCKPCNARKTARSLVPHIASKFWPPSEHLLDTRPSFAILTAHRESKSERAKMRYAAKKKLAVA